jgi:hypothetical protein
MADGQVKYDNLWLAEVLGGLGFRVDLNELPDEPDKLTVVLLGFLIATAQHAVTEATDPNGELAQQAYHKAVSELGGSCTLGCEYDVQDGVKWADR